VKRNIPRLVEHIQAGRLKPSEMITHRLPLEEIPEAYHRFSSKLDECIKTVLIPPKAA
jgi:threonine dehydrogenase-like Zn-dependent dehydrogenase